MAVSLHTDIFPSVTTDKYGIVDCMNTHGMPAVAASFWNSGRCFSFYTWEHLDGFWKCSHVLLLCLNEPSSGELYYFILKRHPL